MSMKPDQERLSEQARPDFQAAEGHAGAVLYSARSPMHPLTEDSPAANLARAYLSLARQLTEAERENAELRNIVYEDWLATEPPQPERWYFDELLKRRLDAVLNTAEPPGSPPKSSSGEALDTGGSEG